MSMLNAANYCYIPPPIPFHRPERKELDKDKYMVAKLRSNPEEASSQTYELNVPYFDTGCPEVWLQFTDNLKRVLKGQNIKEAPAMVQMAKRLMQGDALAEFNHAWNKREEGEDSAEMFESCLQDISKHVSPHKHYIFRRNICITICVNC